MPAKIRRRGKNSYEFNVSDGYDEFGKQKGFSETFHFDSMAEAKAAYILYAAECKKGNVTPTGTPRMTLAEFYEYWTKHYAEGNLSPASKSYNDYLSTRLLACLGGVRVEKITSKHILEFLTQLRAPDAGIKNKPLSASTVRKHFTMLKELLNYAVKWEFITINPANKVDTPKGNSKSKKIPSQADFNAFFTAVMESATPKQKLWVLMAFDMGLRREEIFGLKYSDIDFKKRLLRIGRAVIYTTAEGVTVKNTKTASSIRTLGMSPMTFAALQAHITDARRIVRNRIKRKKVIPLADPFAPDSWLFTQPDYSVAHPHSFNNFLKAFCLENGLCNISPHLLRHLSGSYLLNSGVDLATVSNMLGHRQKAFTANVYIHAIQEVDPRVADAMQNIMTNILENGKSPV